MLKKSRIKNIARRILNKANLRLWNFKFNDSIRYVGLCDHYNHIIYLSNKYYKKMSYLEVRRVLLHETAHAMFEYKQFKPVIQHVLFPHNMDFQNRFNKIGGKKDNIEIRCQTIWDYITMPIRLCQLLILTPFAIIALLMSYYRM